MGVVVCAEESYSGDAPVELVCVPSHVSVPQSGDKTLHVSDLATEAQGRASFLHYWSN